MTFFYAVSQKSPTYFFEIAPLCQPLRELPDKNCDPSPGNFVAHFLFSSLTNTTYPGVSPTISSLALRPKLGLHRNPRKLTFLALCVTDTLGNSISTIFIKYVLNVSLV